jgi:hypothetical protein
MLSSFEDSEETNKDPELPTLGVNYGRGLFGGVMNSVRILEKMVEQHKKIDANNFLDTSGKFIALHINSNQ